MLWGFYIGADDDLKGETAILRETATSAVLAQFDNYAAGLSRGWHRYARSDFVIVDHGRRQETAKEHVEYLPPIDWPLDSSKGVR